MKINTENKELGNVGKIIDFLIVKLDNGTIIEVGGIKHIDTVCTSEVKYNIIFDGSDEYLSKCIEKQNQDNLNRIDSMQKQIEECKNSIIKGKWYGT